MCDELTEISIDIALAGITHRFHRLQYFASIVVDCRNDRWLMQLLQKSVTVSEYQASKQSAEQKQQ